MDSPIAIVATVSKRHISSGKTVFKPFDELIQMPFLTCEKTVIFQRRHHVDQLAEVRPFRISSRHAVIRSGDGLSAGLCTHDNSSGKNDNKASGESSDLCTS